MHKLRFRQIHLDYHTSPSIENIGGRFDKKQFQDALKAGHVDSITCFAKCHHGWSYHETSVGKPHPYLATDLLQQQYDACREIDVNIPIYLSAGVDNVASWEHPEWREVAHDGRYTGWAPAVIQAGFHKLCFNTPYVDYLCEQIREVARMFPDCHGIFLDIIQQHQCCCKWCLQVMEENGWDATKEEDRLKCAQHGLERYYRMTTEASKCDDPDMPVFHNSGHIERGNRDILKYFSHLELESLPTGGWGYDHFPISAKYCGNLPYDFLGMTGKFHTTWGEFGGYKHPNALRYECAAMLAYGAKCSVGDQLHPEGEMDMSTYSIIGAAYSEVEAKEPWCVDTQNVAEIGLVSSAAVHPGAHRDDAADIGAGRILLEGHFLFDVLDGEMDFSKYKVLVLPDDVRITPELQTKLDSYLAQGGKLFLTGESGLKADGQGFALDIGAQWYGASEYCPDYALPVEELRASFVNTPMVMYMKSQRIKVTDGESLGDVYDPYFNRAFNHFCSHQHTPNRPDASGFACGVRKGNVVYLSHPVFSIYRGLGAVAYKEYVINALRSLLGESMVKADMPSTARLSLAEQPQENRYILHLLYANTINRGGEMNLAGGTVTGQTRSVEVIEDLLPLQDVKVCVKADRKIARITLEPQGGELEFTQGDDGTVELTVSEVLCHQMVVLHYA